MGSQHKNTQDSHAPTHTHTYHSTHTAQTRICNVHTHVGVVNTNLMCDCCCIPWLPQSRELLHQRRKTADIWIFRCRARLQLRGKRPRDNLPDFASLNALSTRLGAHPRPKLAPWFTGGPSACPQPGAAVQHSTAQYSTQYYTIVVQYSVQYSIAVQYSSTVQQYSTVQCTVLVQATSSCDRFRQLSILWPVKQTVKREKRVKRTRHR